MILSFFNKKKTNQIRLNNIFVQLSCQNDVQSLSNSIIGNKHTIKIKDEDYKSGSPILIQNGKIYDIDVSIPDENGREKIILPKKSNVDFFIKITNYQQNESIEFEHVESLEVTN